MRGGMGWLLMVGLVGVGPVLAREALPWDLQLPARRVGRAALRVVNRCREPHAFEVRVPAGGWLRLGEAGPVGVAPGEARTVEVEVDTTDLDVGFVEARVEVRCVDCGGEPGCRQERDVLQVRLKVLWPPDDPGLEEPSVPQQVLAALDPAARRQVGELEGRYGLKALRTTELASIDTVLVLFHVPDPRRAVPGVVRELQADPRVRWAQPNFVYRTTGGGGDPYAPLQYGLESIRAHRLAPAVTGRGVRIALLDTGVDWAHVELRGRVVERANFVEDDPGFRADLHGTLMAGVLVAAADNGVGLRGVAPGARLLAFKVCRPQAPGAVEALCTSQALARGIDAAIGRRVHVLHLSLAGPRDPLVARLLREAFVRGIGAVAAVGNDGPEAAVRHPAALPEVIAVSAVGPDDALYPRANRGKVDVVAPGVDILSTAPGDGFRPFTGTSMAVPHVVGVIALILEVAPLLRPEAVRHVLEATARDLGPPGKDPAFGSGCVDAERAVEAARVHPP